MLSLGTSPLLDKDWPWWGVGHSDVLPRPGFGSAELQLLVQALLRGGLPIPFAGWPTEPVITRLHWVPPDYLPILSRSGVSLSDSDHPRGQCCREPLPPELEVWKMGVR